MLKKLFVVFFLCVSGIAMAQQGTTSPYSFYGIGTLKFKGTVENRSMGGISTYSDSIHLNIQNPAGVAGLRLVNYTLGASYKFNTQNTETDSQQASTTSLDYLAIGIPLGKFGASFGLIPYTSVGYKLSSEGDNGTIQYFGDGGLNKAFLTLAYEFVEGLSVGADLNYNFGNIENTALNIPNELQFGTRETNTSDLLGFSFNFGAQYKTMVSENLELSTSVSYTPETDFTAENSRRIETVLIDRDDNSVDGIADQRDIPVSDSNFTFPSQYTIGVGIGKPKNWFVAAEYTDQKTSNFTNRTFDIDNVVFTDATKVRLGGFYIPDYSSITSYFGRVVYRAGFRYEETGINIDGQDIQEFGISFGVGLPVGRVFSNANIGFEVGRRGTTDFGLIQENFFNTFISLSLNDRWFQKRYID